MQKSTNVVTKWIIFHRRHSCYILGDWNCYGQSAGITFLSAVLKHHFLNKNVFPNWIHVPIEILPGWKDTVKGVSSWVILAQQGDGVLYAIRDDDDDYEHTCQLLISGLCYICQSLWILHRYSTSTQNWKVLISVAVL